MFGDNIKRIRELKGYGVNELARISGVNASYISALERGEKKNPSVEILEKIANALEVSIDEIMRGVMDEVAIDSLREEYELLKTKEFKSAEAAMQFILKQPAIMGFGGLHPEQLTDEDVIELANELLTQFKNLSYKYKYKNNN